MQNGVKLAICLLMTVLAANADSGAYQSETSAHQRSRSETLEHSRRYCSTCERSASGRIKRSPAARQAFRRDHPCPATGLTRGACPGYEIDHVIPLHWGGADEPNNMQWLTHREHLKKTASER